MKWIINLPEQVKIENGTITITGNVGWSVIEKAVHNAVPYEAPKEVKEQGEAGLKEVEKVAIRKGMIYTSPEKLTTEPNKGMFQSRAWLDNNNWHYFTCDTKRECDKTATEWMNDYRDLHPAPVASGLREAAIEAADVLNSIMPSNPRSKKREWIWQVHDRLTKAINQLPSTPQAEKVDRTEELVGSLRAKAKSRHISGKTTQCEGYITENELEEVLADYDKGEK